MYKTICIMYVSGCKKNNIWSVKGAGVRNAWIANSLRPETLNRLCYRP